MSIDEKIGELRAEIEAKNKQIADKQEEVIKIKRERGAKLSTLVGALREKYGSFIGRVVQVSGKGAFGYDRETEGVLSSEAFMVYGEYVLPVLYKIKKDGTASKTHVSEWQLPRVNKQFTIKLKYHD